MKISVGLLAVDRHDAMRSRHEGHAAAAPSPTMNSRRRIPDPSR